MAEKTITLYGTAAAVVKGSAPATHFSAGAEVTLGTADDPALIVKFDAIPSAYQFCRIQEEYQKLMVYLCHESARATWPQVNAYCLQQAVDIASVTDAAAQKNRHMGRAGLDYDELPGWAEVELTSYGTRYDTDWADAAKYGVRFEGYGNEYHDTMYYPAMETPYGSHKPYLQLTLDTADLVGLVLASRAPTSGFVDRTKPAIFRWSVQADGVCIGEVAQTSAVFRWRQGASGTVHEISCGTANSCTVPANTFPGTNELQWQVTVTANTGKSVTSDWYTLTTADAACSAEIESPDSVILDGSAANTFAWRHIIATGTQPTGYDLQKSTDGVSWTALRSETNTAAVSTVIPADTLPAGTLYWRVRTYNADGTAGSWSDAAQVIVIAPPAQPGVTVQEESPRPVLQWTSTGQQGYEVEIGDYRSGTVFGPDQRWRCPEILPDGQYVARVRVVNTYGLWSDWGSTPLTVSHTAGAAITLQVSAGHRAELSWSTSGTYDRYIVLRDGKPIARVKARSYTDHKSMGAVAYQVMGLPAEGYNYGRSNDVTCEISAGTLMLCDLDAGEWHALSLSDQQHRQFTESLTQTVTRVSLAGRAYPVAEKTPWHDRSISITWAHSDPLLLAKYDALEGKAVCVKTPGGRMICGILDSLQRTEGVFYTAYSATVWQLDDSEVIDYDP